MFYLSFLYGLFGLSFLVFIHELGHFFAARYYGMRVAVFSVGMGPALVSWVRNEIEYKIGMIPFGGYVSILGMDEETEDEKSYFKKGPYQRFVVSFAGPFVNLVFAFIGFSMIYMAGGSLKDSVDGSNIVGMVDPQSKVYELGLRPGDRIEKINGQKAEGRQGFFFHNLLDAPTSLIEGESINYVTHERKPFSFEVESTKKVVQGVELHMNGLSTPASYLLLDSKRTAAITAKDSPFEKAGLEDGDRLIWANGELIFSREQLQNLLAEEVAFLTVLRDHQVIHVKVPKVALSTLKLSGDEKEELNDLRFDAKLPLIQEAKFIPYAIDQEAIVSGIVGEDALLKFNDRILAVDGVRTPTGGDVMRRLQEKHIVTIFAHDTYEPLSQDLLVKDFYQDVNFTDMQRLIGKIGIEAKDQKIGNLKLLAAVEPMQVEHQGEIAYRLGLHLVDRQIVVNPGPMTLFFGSIRDMGRLFSHLTQGDLSPKYLSGPVGIITVMQRGWADGFTEGMFLLSTISLNLGLFNLLPLPVLDGGHIMFSFYEMITRKRIDRKLMERLLFPCALLLIGFAIFTTFHDILRLVNIFKS